MEITSVIKGDIMNSRKVRPANIWLDALKGKLNQVGPSPKIWEIFMGDLFQVEVSNVVEVLRIAISIKATMKCIKGLDVKMAIGVGSRTYDAPRISESNGDAFVFSGELFDNLKKTTLAIKSPWKEVDEQVNVMIDLALLTMNEWKPATAQIVSLSLEMPDSNQEEIGEKLGIRQNSVSEGLKRAGFEDIVKMENQFRKLILNKL